MCKTVFGIVGGGWRSEFYLRIAKALPERFEICGMVVRDENKGNLIEKKWGVKTYRTIKNLLKTSTPQFVVVSVSWSSAPSAARELADRSVPVLAETPPAPDLDGLIQLNKLVESGTKIQVAEQYHLQPLHAARIAIANSGMLGEVTQAQVSVCHGYHGVSLIRKLLGITFEDAVISAHSYVSPITGGYDIHGQLNEERTVDSLQTIAVMNFGGKLAVYDFTEDQYFSWIRSHRVLVRGKNGEICNGTVRYLKDFQTPVELELKRWNSGEDGNLEGHCQKGILAGDEWVYRNPFIPGRLTDDEIAVASCLEKMKNYVQGGSGFYSLAEASQDHYLAMMISESVRTKETVITVRQPWAFS